MEEELNIIIYSLVEDLKVHYKQNSSITSGHEKILALVITTFDLLLENKEKLVEIRAYYQELMYLKNLILKVMPSYNYLIRELCNLAQLNNVKFKFTSCDFTIQKDLQKINCLQKMPLITIKNFLWCFFPYWLNVWLNDISEYQEQTMSVIDQHLRECILSA